MGAPGAPVLPSHFYHPRRLRTLSRVVSASAAEIAGRTAPVATHLYGQEINAETFAICKADLLLKGEGEAADNIVGGPEHSTLSNDANPGREFDFMLSNPPYGKSWKTDLERMGGKRDMRDPRFVIEHAGDPEYSLVTRSSDGQMLFLANKLSKMKQNTALGSRIVEVHNGSSLFDNDAFGYWKVTVERPLRIEGADPNRAYKVAEIKKLKETGERSETAPPVIRKIHKRGTDADPLRGRFAATIDGRPAVVEYEVDTDLRDTEQIPLQEAGGIEAFLHRDVLPYAADAWYRTDSVRTGYEISFTRYFYKPLPMRTLGEIRADIPVLEKETEGLLDQILGETVQ